MSGDIIVRGRYPTQELEKLREEFPVHYFVGAAELDPAIDAISPRVGVVVTTGSVGLTGAQMRRLPNLSLIVVRGAGSENVDKAEAERLGLRIVGSEGINAFSVADHAMALLLAMLRDVAFYDRAAREQDWPTLKASRPAPPVLYGKRVGILGLGNIGRQIARRLEAFDAAISYHNRSRRDDAPYDFKDSPIELATDSDILVVCCPGGSATRHLVDDQLLEALGPGGYLVNVGRGSVVDNGALSRALRDGRLAAAAVDVLDGEPAIPEELRELPNLIITPHMGSNSPAAEAATHRHVVEVLRAHFAQNGKGVTA